jgi:AcrR family transcriptional regulator
MDDVARRAGVSVMTLLRHFPRRSDLVDAVYQGGLAELRAMSDAPREPYEPWRDLTEWLHAFLDFSELTMTMFGTLDRIVESAPNLELRTHEVDEAFAAVFDRAHAAGVIRPDITRRDVIQLVGGLVFSLASDKLRHEYLFGVLMAGIRPTGR